jgi:hypothetical protein
MKTVRRGVRCGQKGRNCFYELRWDRYGAMVANLYYAQTLITRSGRRSGCRKGGAEAKGEKLKRLKR